MTGPPRAHPVVSVVIPAHNSRHHIQEALDSVIEQSRDDIEIIVVDDASTDGTADLVRTYAERRTQAGAGRDMRVITLTENVGPAGARNAGIEAARGRWVAFLDADDVWVPEKLRSQLQLIPGHPDVVLFCGRPAPFRLEQRRQDTPASATGPVVKESDDRHGRWGTEGDRTIALEELSQHNPVATSTVLARRDVLNQVGGFDTNFHGPEDYDLWLRVAAQGDIYYSCALMSRYRYGALSLSTDDTSFLPQVLRVIDKAYGSSGALSGRPGRNRAKAYQYLSASWMAAEQRRLGRACRLFLRSLSLWPWRFGKHSPLPLGRTKLLARFLRIALAGNRGGAVSDTPGGYGH